eukprot:6468424-Amphidinium_carterae.1
MPKVKRILATESHEQRIRERRALGKLSSLIVLPATLLRYTDSVEAFVAWLRQTRRPFPVSAHACDLALSVFIEDMWDWGEPRSLVANTLSGIQHFLPVLRHKLPSSWRLFSAWG